MARGETYEQFVNKFKQKKTTDDCYTPEAVMDVVNDYVERVAVRNKTPEGKKIYGGAVIYEELDAETHRGSHSGRAETSERR